MCDLVNPQIRDARINVVFHEDHHQPKYANVFERNDIVIFAVPSIVYFSTMALRRN
jgi:hypothetical protein